MTTTIPPGGRSSDPAGEPEGSGLGLPKLKTHRNYLSLYILNILAGAGTFTIAQAVPGVGIIPAIVSAIIVMLVTTVAVLRAQRANREADPTRPIVSAAVTKLGGLPAAALALFGVGQYSLLAATGYTLLAVQQLAVVDGVVRGIDNENTWAISFVAAVALFWAKLRSPWPQIGKTVAAVGAVWFATIGLADLLDFQGERANALYFLSFPISVRMLRMLPPDAATENDPVKLQPAHQRSVYTSLTQYGLMLLLGVGVVIHVYMNSPDGLVNPVWIASSFDPAAVAAMAGVVCFAAVGTGAYTAAGTYPEMRKPDTAKNVVTKSMFALGLLQISWSAVALVTLTPDNLEKLDARREPTTLGVARLIDDPSGATITEAADPSLIGAIGLIVAAAIVMFAVTGACSGFIESVDSEYRHGFRRTILPGEASVEPERVHIGLVGIATGIAWTLDYFGVDITVVLASSMIGSSILLFILPILAEPDPDRRRRTGDIAIGIALMTMFAGIVLVIGSAVGMAIMTAFGLIGVVLTVLTVVAITKKTDS